MDAFERDGLDWKMKEFIYVRLQIDKRWKCLRQNLNVQQSAAINTVKHTFMEDLPLSELSTREREIFDLFGRGFDVKKVAAKLTISARTVEQHRNNIKNKLRIRRSHDLFVAAIEQRHKPNLASSDTAIVLIEDEPLEAELIQDCLKDMKLENPVVWFTEGKSALNYIQNNNDNESVGLIILDLILPGMTGVELLKQVKTSSATNMIPVIALTSSADPKDRRSVLSMGATGYITKPSSVDELKDALSSTINFLSYCDSAV